MSKILSLSTATFWCCFIIATPLYDLITKNTGVRDGVFHNTDIVCMSWAGAIPLTVHKELIGAPFNLDKQYFEGPVARFTNTFSERDLCGLCNQIGLFMDQHPRHRRSESFVDRTYVEIKDVKPRPRAISPVFTHEYTTLHRGTCENESPREKAESVTQKPLVSSQLTAHDRQ